MHDETLRDTLSERFEGFSSQPNDSVWESIEKVLDEDEKAAGYRFNLLSPLIITLLIGSSAAALALFVYFSDMETTSSFPLADGPRTHHSRISNHLPLELAADEISTVEAQSIFIQQPIPPVPAPEERKKLIYAEIDTKPILPLQTKSLTDHSINGTCDLYLIRENSDRKMELTHFYDRIPEEEERAFYGIGDKHSSLSVEFLLSSFANLSSSKKSTPSESYESPQPGTLSSAQSVEKSNRFAEAELNFNGYFSKRIKGGLGVSVGYSSEQGNMGANTSYETTQWSIGIPITIGMDLLRRGRFNIGVAAKLLNDFDQRKSTEHSTVIVPNGLSTEVLQSTSVSKDQIYRFGFQPMLTGSYFLTPRSALSLGLAYRYYFNDSRVSNVRFHQKSYLGINLGIRFLL